MEIQIFGAGMKRTTMVVALGLSAWGCTGKATPEPEGSASRARIVALETAPPASFDSVVRAGVEPAPIERGQNPPRGPYAPGFDVSFYDIELDLRNATDNPPTITGVVTITLEVRHRPTASGNVNGPDARAGKGFRPFDSDDH